MALRIATPTQIQRDPRDAGVSPRAVYFMDHPSVAGVYVLGVDAKSAEATAFLKDNGSGVYVLDNDPSEEDRIPLLLSTSVVLV